MRKRIDHWCSVVPEKSQPSGPLFSGKLGKPLIPLERWALGWGFFLSPLNTNDVFYLSHTPIPALGKDKKRIASRSSHIDPWCNCNVKMTSPCRISSYSGFSGSIFLQVFPISMMYLVVSRKKNPLFMWGWDRKIRPLRSPIVITQQTSWCQSVILVTDFSIPPYAYTPMMLSL